jgi:hypothetical protein
MIGETAGLVIFAIQSGLKLAAQARQALVDATKRRDLTLPLPDFFAGSTPTLAVQYFGAGTGAGHAEKTPRVRQLVAQFKAGGGLLPPAEEQELLEFHREFVNVDRAREGRFSKAGDGWAIDPDHFSAVMTIRQWSRETDPTVSALQRLSGTLVEIGVDYFAHTPGALNRDTAHGKLLGSFLQAVDDLKFSEVALPDLPGKLMVATLETLSGNTQLLGGDPRVQDLVRVATVSLSKDVAARIEEIRKPPGNLKEEGRVGAWAELVFRSVLSSAAPKVLEDPGRYLGVHGAGEEALVTRVGGAVLGLVVQGDGFDFDRLIGRQGVEKIVQAALLTLGDHPELVLKSDAHGLKGLLAEIATGLGKFDTLKTPDLLPEMMRLILEKTGKNLPLLWPDLAKPGNNLLLGAAQTTMEILTRTPPDGSAWTPSFTRDDLVAVADGTLDALAANPNWLLDKAGDDGPLRAVLSSVLGVLREKADQRLSPALAVEVLQSAVVAVAGRREFLAAAGPDAEPIVAGVVRVVVGGFFGKLSPDAAWQLGRSEVAAVAVKTALDRLGRGKVDEKTLASVEAAVQGVVRRVTAGEGWDPAMLVELLPVAVAAASSRGKPKKPK